MQLYLIVKEDNAYIEEELETAFFDKNDAIIYIDNKMKEASTITDTKEWKRYKLLLDRSDIKELLNNEAKEFQILFNKFEDFIEYNWYIKEIKIADATKFFRNKKINYLLNN